MPLLTEINRFRGESRGVNLRALYDVISTEPGEYPAIDQVIAEYRPNSAKSILGRTVSGAGWQRRSDRSRYWEAPE